jgi:VWFA-related protein
MRNFLSLPLVAAAALALIAQNEQPIPSYSANVNVVNVLATVRDKHGNIVNNLTAGDFALEEDGRPQNIHYFSRQTDLPLTLGLLVDTSRSVQGSLEGERSASVSFVNQVVREGKDSAFLIHFDREVELLQDLTDSHQKLEKAIGELAPSPPPSQRQDDDSTAGGTSSPGTGGGYPGTGGGYPRGGRGGPGGGQHWRAGTLLYDSIFLASDELMQKQKGRKAVIVLSDGVDRGSKTSLEKAIESAQRANTIVYAIFFKGEQDNAGRGNPGGWGRGGGMGGGPWGGRRGGGYPGGGYPGGGRPPEERVDGKKILERISRETGGRMYEISKKQTVEHTYQEIQDELRNQYNLGYTPDRKPDEAPGYRKITLTAKDKDLVVQARDGYYAPPAPDREPGK